MRPEKAEEDERKVNIIYVSSMILIFVCYIILMAIGNMTGLLWFTIPTNILLIIILLSIATTLLNKFR
jgi:hypothetical protein